MKTICFYFQVHQPFRLKKYRFFDISEDDYYYDDFSNRNLMRKIAERCYLPANEMLLKMFNEYGNQFKVSFSISGIALDQFEMYAPDVLESFKRLAETGNVEFLSETYSHSLVALKSKEEFVQQVELHSKRIETLFGQRPKVFRNTELVYSDEIGEMVAEMGYKAMLTEGAKHILGWKSPNYLYYNAINPKLKILLRNYKLSDDIAFRFSNQGWKDWPLTAEKFVGWLKEADAKEEIINLFMDYETFGEHQWKETGIFDFMEALPHFVFQETDYQFGTPTEIAEKHQPVAAFNVNYPISWADEERDLTAWLGNKLQNEAFTKFYELQQYVDKVQDEKLKRDWLYLQTSDHFYYMCTKFFSDGDVHKYFTPYDSPYDAFINYMNVLSDFEERLKLAPKKDVPEVESINIEELISEYKAKLDKLEAQKAKTSEVKAIEKTKPKAKAIEKTKPKAKAIEKTKPKAKAIEKTKPKTKAIEKTKPKVKAISKTKKVPKAIDKKKVGGNSKK